MAYRSSPIRSASNERENNEKKILISFHSDFSVEEDGSRSNSMKNNEGEASSSTTKVGRGARGRRGSTTKQPRPSNLVVLWTAVRPHTLTASLCPCFVAMAATVAGRRKDSSNNGGGGSSSSTTTAAAADWDIAFLWTLFCLCIQIGVSAFLSRPPFFRPLFFSIFQ